MSGIQWSNFAWSRYPWPVDDTIARIYRTGAGKYRVCSVRDRTAGAFDPKYDTKADAMRAALDSGYTHGTGSGMYHSGVRELRSELHMP